MTPVCAAKIGARKCQHDRAPGSMFCRNHLTSGARFELPARIHLSEELLDQVSLEEIRREFSRR